ncbi:MAG: hypothetical protein ABIT64_03515 [Lysobacteraceae bacterium]
MIRIIIGCALACLLAACAPTPAARSSAVSPPTSAMPFPATASKAFDPGNVSRACKVDSDCVVKNVGNCCGRYPACVNKDAPVNPAAVRAQCMRDHRMSVCNVPMISSCSCVHNQCGNNTGTSAPGNL